MKDSPNKLYLPKQMGEVQLDDLRTRWTNYIEDLGWNRLGLQIRKMLHVMKDREVWRLNLELLPQQPSQKSGQ